MCIRLKFACASDGLKKPHLAPKITPNQPPSRPSTSPTSTTFWRRHEHRRPTICGIIKSQLKSTAHLPFPTSASCGCRFRTARTSDRWRFRCRFRRCGWGIPSLIITALMFSMLEMQMSWLIVAWSHWSPFSNPHGKLKGNVLVGVSPSIAVFCQSRKSPLHFSSEYDTIPPLSTNAVN